MLLLFSPFEEHLLYVAEHARGSGLGTALMEQAFSFGKSHNHAFAFVETMSFQALEFYQKMGFFLEYTRTEYAHNASAHYLRKDF